MREIKLPFGRIANGTLVSINDVVRGLDCECVCPQCFGMLIACKGEIVRPYFRHYADPVLCIKARETALHIYAKQLIVRARRLTVPREIGVIKSAELETRLPFGMRPDVLLEYETGETLAVEVWVEHQVPAGKTKIYAENNQAGIEIDLRAYRYADQDDWDTLILDTAPRHWIVPPLVIRLENEARRQAKIDEMRAARAAAVAEMEAAEAARRQEEKKRDAMEEGEAKRAQTNEVARAIALARATLDAAERQQEIVKLAEERAKTAELRAAVARQRKREMQAPDLHDLIKAFGLYSAITPEAWAKYDAEIARWQERVRNGDFYQPEYVEAKRLAS